MAHSSDYRVLSRPCEVFWSGFRSDTYILQNAGWELAAEESPYDRSIRLLMRHRDLRLYAVTSREEFDFFQHANRGGGGDGPRFQVTHVAPRIELLTMHDNLSRFKQIDAVPQFVNTERKSVEDFNIFAVPLVRTEEIIVAPADVSELMEQIRRMQAPEQKAIRDREMARSREGMAPGSMPTHKFHAQILSFDTTAKAA